MCSTEASNYAKEIVGDFIAQKKQFTAKDVTDEIKDRLKQAGLPFERHAELKGAVHSECDSQMDAGWDRTPITVPGAPSAAFLYHPVGTDPQDYLDALSGARRSLLATQFSNSAPALPAPGTGFTPVALPAQPRRSNNPADRCVGRHGRLIIARKFLNAINLTPGDRVYVSRDQASDRLVITKQPTGLPTTAEVRVDCQGRVRISRKARAGVDGQRFQIAQVNDRVEVSPA